ncbi:DNA/RNA polymerase [Phytophthora palmivora]|uniref:DNA/RNA polymerase n=1 Tax=Phytophthora palmivora TaxID=4796 RepID=A0A2P4X077_9STRA|nr:DNA/RNA polymerase [Phytophthora palmivora]
MRGNIPEYNALTESLYTVRESAATVAQSRKKSRLNHVLLSSVGWIFEHDTALVQDKDALLKMVTLARPKQEWEVCLFADASQAVFTDDRNLQYIFDPLAVSSTLGRHQVDRLQRRSMTLTAFRYVIEHVRGEENIWGDLLSRWRWGAGSVAATPPARMHALMVVDRVSPLQEADFIWLSQGDIENEQRRELVERDLTDTPPTCSWITDINLYVTDSGKIWIQANIVDLQQRLCVAAHARLSGHRGANTTERMLAEKFEWPTLSDDIRKFVRGCLHSMVVGDRVIPRPFGEALHASAPNEVLHFDFLSLPACTTGARYVLVLKDDMSGYCELVVCADPTAEATCRCLLDWFKRFGPVPQWVSDQGTHFKNQLLEMLQKSYDGSHHFTTAYCSWANGSVEVMNRLLLKRLRAMLSELKLHISDWSTVLPLVQSALNQIPSDRLGGVAPVTAFTALPASPPIHSILHPQTTEVFDVQAEYTEQRDHIAAVQASVEDMHQMLSHQAEQRRAQARDRRAVKRGVDMANYEIGDFVLVAQVTGRANKLAVH